ncbi:sigma-54-dependent transcriptional regulator [Thiorhodovibrio frisius]|uniref:Response regulator with CheY-like receiver, AAA-type ATPase, and DNA-binding domains n=1 Tax=Thiorhodovibrio frisius TaxID=631362 RepID=H8Z055_9GAMM|nr:sigma-54 dependent transcriptional regulator [Thiorhodovibrio frisius]EIC22263.1 response regulator with CheY-like receiver, AAA-type ATPase, and DNA-binding domains [Thiorhodovibrio frisius]WPL24558.1 Quorum-sensing regulator protein F [Thiorhodovibrio frisius]
MPKAAAKSKARALVVDDEPDILDLVRITLARMGLEAQCVGTLKAARQALAADRFDFCLTDMRLPDGDGTDLVRHASASCPEMPVAMVTAYGNMESAVAAMKAGAFDFVSKPLDLRVLRELAAAALRARGRATDSLNTSDGPQTKLIGESPQILELRTLIAKLARNQAPVFISGESGTGKELAASLIHQLGPRADQPFVPVNCGAIPADLVESELFGHRKGSFTGATSDKPGLFQAAQGGTLLLDEIADLPLPMQVKLLRAIQEKSVRPVGAAKEVPVDVRIISASHLNLADAVARGAFRQDLFYRINVIDLHLPPLRERTGDIPMLVAHLLPRIAAESGSPAESLADDAMAALCNYAFPGNVRELENILERASALCESSVLTAADLRLPDLQQTPAAMSSHPSAAAPLASAPPTAQRPLAERLDAIEKPLLLDALQQSDQNPELAAARLGLSPRSLRLRRARLGLAPDDAT